MKDNIKKICVWYLTKYYPTTLKNISIDADRFSFEFGGYVPDDNKWHHFAATFECWIRKEPKNKPLFDSAAIYMDSALVGEYHFDVPEPKIKNEKDT